MASSLIHSGHSNTAVAFNNTFYKPMIGGGLIEGGPIVNNTTGSYICKIREAGIIKNMWIHVFSNTLNGALTVNTQKDGTASPMNISVGAGLSGVFENTATVEFLNSGDWLYMQLVGSGSAGSASVAEASYEYISYDPTETVYRNGLSWFGNYPTTASTTFFTNYNGIANPGTPFAEADVKTKMRQGGLIRNLYARVNANARANSSTVTLRLNGADSALTVSIGAGVTGDFEDLTDVVTIAAGDDVNFATTIGAAAAALTLTSIVTSFVTQNYANISLLSCGSSDDVFEDIFPGGNTSYFGIHIGSLNSSATESDVQHVMRAINFTFMNLSVHVQTNNLTGSSTLNFRKNTADGNMSLSIPNATTGFFADNTAIDQTAPGDLVNYKIVTGGTGTTFIVTSITCNTLIPNLNLMTFL